MDFKEFCEKTAKFLGLELVPMKENAKKAVTYKATKTLPNPPFEVEFFDWRTSAYHLDFHADVYGKINGKKVCIGMIGMEEAENGEYYFEHWDVAISPEGRYNEEFLPVDENGEEVDGELWSYYRGNSLKRACNSFLKGGALTNPNRKPQEKW